MSDREKHEQEPGSQAGGGVRETNRQVVFLWNRVRQAVVLPSVLEAGQESSAECFISWLAGEFVLFPRVWKTQEGFKLGGNMIGGKIPANHSMEAGGQDWRQEYKTPVKVEFQINDE